MSSSARNDPGDAKAHLWHPFADMSQVVSEECVIDRGEGVWVFDVDGKRYLDASAGLWYCNIGHGRAELAEVARRQMSHLECYQLFHIFANAPALELADRLCAIAPLGEDSVAFFTSGGSESVDTAAKIARRYWTVEGQPERRIIISREGAYHGVNAFGTSLSGIESNAAGWGPLVGDVLVVPRHDVAALERALEEHPGRVAAFIGEPVQGAAGVYPPQSDYWTSVKDLCREHDVLLITDEVVTGFGRLGSWFGSERYGIEPDIMLGAKGLSSGYLPIGFVMGSRRIREVLWSAKAGVFRHGYTYSGHPTACAVALANLDVIEREDLLGHVRRMEPVLAERMRALEAHPLVEEVRSAGLLAGVELSETARGEDPGLLEHAVEAARDRGVLLRNLLGRALQISPPLTIGEQEIELLATVLRETFDHLLTLPTGSGHPSVSARA